MIKSLLASFRFRCGQEFYTLLLDNKSVERQQKPLFSGHNRDHLKTQDCVSTSRQADLLGSILGNNARCRGLAAAKCRGFHVSTDNQVVRYLPPKETVPTGQFRYSLSLKNLPWTRQYVKVRSLANELGNFRTWPLYWGQCSTSQQTAYQKMAAIQSWHWVGEERGGFVDALLMSGVRGHWWETMERWRNSEQQNSISESTVPAAARPQRPVLTS